MEHMDKIVKKVSDYIKTNKLIAEGDRILMGISGGADSVCLLLLLCELREKYRLTLKSVHINHGIRGESAARDEAFTGELCGRLGVEFESVRGDIPALALQTHTTCEEAGRNFRYEVFSRLAQEGGYNRVAIAHNCDDNAETVLFNIFRGSGLAGVRGIRPVRAIGASGVNIIRPVLCLSRCEIEEFLRNRDTGWCTDETNLENAYSRNIIRNCILPVVREQLNGNVTENIARLSAQAAELEDFLSELVRRELDSCEWQYSAEGGTDPDQASSVMEGQTPKVAERNIIYDKCPTACIISEAHLRGLHPALQRALIRACFSRLSEGLKDVESTHIGQIMALLQNQVGRKTDLPYGLEAEKTYTGIVLRKKKFGQGATRPGIGIAGFSEEAVTLDRLGTRYREISISENMKLTLSLMEKTEPVVDYPKNDCIQWFDYDKIQNSLKIRFRQPGDYILIGSGGSKKSLNRYMIDVKLPAQQRDSLPLLADGDHILWIPGYRRDDSCYVTEATKCILVAEMSKKG